MKIMNDAVFDYLNFARKFGQIKWMMFLSQSLLMPECEISDTGKIALNSQNERRRNVQNHAADLHLSFTEICSRCEGYCCMKSYDHFSALDYWIRKYSSAPLEGYGIELFEPWYIYILRYRLNVPFYPKPYVSSNGCKHLSQEGCNISSPERPIRCIAFTCDEFRKTADPETKAEYSNIIKDLYEISHDTFVLLKKEAGIPFLYGELSILLHP